MTKPRSRRRTKAKRPRAAVPKAVRADDAVSTRDPKDAETPSPVEVSVVPLTKLTPLADNPRSHTTRGIDFIASSLDRVGAARSGVIDEKRVILAGNGMQEAAVQAGYRDAIVVRVDGTRPVFVQRANLSPPQKSRVIIDDNRASELSGWNAKLLDYAERDPSIKADWTAPEWRTAVVPERATEGRTDPDATVEPRPTTIVRGDQFQLGAHHLRCGDSTDPADVQALLGDRKPELMATDPPSEITLVYATRSTRLLPAVADHAGQNAAQHETMKTKVVTELSTTGSRDEIP